MKGKHASCKPLLNNILLSCIYCSIICYGVGSLSVLKTCNDIGTFQQMFGISLPMCAEECFRRQRCTVFMFHFGMRHCALKDVIDVQSLGEEGPVCRYYTRDDWSQIDIGPCNGHTCSEAERCISKTDDKFQCVKSECPPPSDIANATIMTNTHSIGTTNRYRCKKELVAHGTPTITCGDDAEWSVTDFVCNTKAESCPSPELQYFNADLIHIEGVMYHPGTVLTFRCREGYRTMGDKWTSTCQSYLRWYPYRIRCCPENTTHGMHHACYAVINAGQATSRGSAYEYCDTIGGRGIAWTHPDMKNLYDKTTTDWALQWTTMTWVDKHWTYTKCAAENGAQGDDSKSVQEKIADVTSNNWEGNVCWWGNIWAPGQPNSTDECMIINLHDSTYGVNDYPCNFEPSMRIGFTCSFAIPAI